ncbi:hypothetical protein [Streptomyces sp. JJ38]|uniref:SCO3933 family regulatory protein n=1 Tax=Streptomyces sp. JJ38 TaxID=2738128 RepID=UPI001C56BA3D|nr:hypothetical protein [Streptomyces sp. JJ38]MBW1599729.1 hypothetical protein [Streptomyces sp. JJ38]
MAKTRIRVGVLPTTRFMLGALPQPKLKDVAAGEIATDRETGELLYTAQVLLMEDDRAELLKVTIPKSGLPANVEAGRPVKLPDLFAVPWANIFNGSLSEGVAYRASALELVE